MSSPRSELAITATMIGVRLREHDSELEKVAVQMAAQEIRLATLDAASKHASDYAVALSARLERLESARIAAPVAPESAETASEVPQEPGNATEAPRPELADAALEYVHGALVEIANALGVRTASDYEEGQDAPNWKLVERILATAAEVAAALRMYRKVQGVVPAERGSVVRPGPGFAAIGPLYDAATLLAWLKEGEA